MTQLQLRCILVSMNGNKFYNLSGATGNILRLLHRIQSVLQTWKCSGKRNLAGNQPKKKRHSRNEVRTDRPDREIWGLGIFFQWNHHLKFFPNVFQRNQQWKFFQISKKINIQTNDRSVQKFGSFGGWAGHYFTAFR